MGSLFSNALLNTFFHYNEVLFELHEIKRLYRLSVNNVNICLSDMSLDFSKSLIAFTYLMGFISQCPSFYFIVGVY